MPEASVPGDRLPKSSFDDVVKELQEQKDNSEKYANDATEVALDIHKEIELQGTTASKERISINNILQYQTEVFSKIAEFSELNNKSILEQSTLLNKLSEEGGVGGKKKKGGPSETDFLGFQMKQSTDHHQELKAGLLTVTDSVKGIHDFLDAQARAEEARRREAEREGAGKKGGGDPTGMDTKKAAKSGGFFGGMFAALGRGAIGIFKGIVKLLKSIGPRFVVGMASLGAGIAAFFGAFAGASDLISRFGGTEGGSIAPLMKNFFDAFSGVKDMAVMTLIIAAGIKIGGMKKAALVKVPLGMAALGAGMAGFFGGIALADGIADWAAQKDLDGTALKKLMANFLGAFEGLKGTAVLFSLLGVAAVAAFATGDNPKAALAMAIKIMGAMTAMGAGIAGFFAGIALTDVIGKIDGIDGKGLKKMVTMFNDAIGSMTIASMTAIGGLIGAVAVLSWLTADTPAAALAMGVKLFGGMTGIGAGIAGFFTGIMLGDFVANMGAASGLDGKALGNLINSFLDSLSGKNMVILGGIVAAGAVLGKLLGPGALVQVPIGMGAIGAGIAAFTVGLLLADGVATLGDKFFKLDGAGLKNLLTNIGQAFEGFGEKKMAAFIALAAIPGLGLSFAVQFGAIGAGIAAFTTGLLLADGMTSILGGDDPGADLKKLFHNMGDALGGFLTNIIKPLEKIDADRLSKVGAAVSGIGVGLAAFAGGGALKATADMVGKAGEKLGAAYDWATSWWSGGKDKDGQKKDMGLGPLQFFADISHSDAFNLPQLDRLGEALQAFGEGFNSFQSSNLGAIFGTMKEAKSSIGGLGRIMVKLSDRKINPARMYKNLAAFAAGMKEVGSAMGNFSVTVQKDSGFVEGMTNMAKSAKDGMATIADGAKKTLSPALEKAQKESDKMIQSFSKETKKRSGLEEARARAKKAGGDLTERDGKPVAQDTTGEKIDVDTSKMTSALETLIVNKTDPTQGLMVEAIVVAAQAQIAAITALPPQIGGELGPGFAAIAAGQDTEN